MFSAYLALRHLFPLYSAQLSCVRIVKFYSLENVVPKEIAVRQPSKALKILST